MEPGQRGDRPADDSGGFQSGVFYGASGRAEIAARLRERHGDEVTARRERSLALQAHPRPLTADERLIVREAAAPVLRDMAATGPIVLDVREEAHADNGSDVVCAWVRSSLGNAAMGISIYLASPVTKRVAELAEQLQEFELEELCAAGRSATWPECPEHPDSHPLEPAVRDDAAMWLCPRSGDVICAIGGWATHARSPHLST